MAVTSMAMWKKEKQGWVTAAPMEEAGQPFKCTIHHPSEGQGCSSLQPQPRSQNLSSVIIQQHLELPRSLPGGAAVLSNPHRAAARLSRLRTRDLWSSIQPCQTKLNLSRLFVCKHWLCQQGFSLSFLLGRVPECVCDLMGASSWRPHYCSSVQSFSQFPGDFLNLVLGWAILTGTECTSRVRSREWSWEMREGNAERAETQGAKKRFFRLPRWCDI